MSIVEQQLGLGVHCGSALPSLESAIEIVRRGASPPWRRPDLNPFNSNGTNEWHAQHDGAHGSSAACTCSPMMEGENAVSGARCSDKTPPPEHGSMSAWGGVAMRRLGSALYVAGYQQRRTGRKWSGFFCAVDRLTLWLRECEQPRPPVP
jgi:hypothetical protein